MGEVSFRRFPFLYVSGMLYYIYVWGVVFEQQGIRLNSFNFPICESSGYD